MSKQTQNKTEESQNPLGVSDEDFLNASPPSVKQEEEDTSDDDAEEEDEQEDTSNAEADTEDEDDDSSDEDEGDDEEEDDPESQDDNEDDGEDKEEDPSKDGSEDDADEDESGNKPDKASAKKSDEQDEEGNDDSKETVSLPKSEHDQLIAFKALIDKPIKANGKEIKLNNVDEVRKLVQQGADYTRKLQALMPYRKTAMMLENASIDNDKLSLLIDVSKGEKGAINKLLKDLKIDSLDLDTEGEVAYTAKDHKVTDEDAVFHEALDEITSSPEGKKSLAVFNSWDTESQNALYGQPALMQVMHEQRQNGIFDVIDAEINRQKALGDIKSGTPYLQAYKEVGDKIAAEGGFNHLNAPDSESDPKSKAKQIPDGEQPAPKRRKVLDTRKGAAKTKASKGDGAEKARANRGNKRKTSTEIKNPLSMSDEEFLKLDQFTGRI